MAKKGKRPKVWAKVEVFFPVEQNKEEFLLWLSEVRN